MQKGLGLIWIILIIILVFLLVVGGIFGWNYLKSQTGQTGSRVGTGCDNLDTSSWLTYQDGYSALYPSQWGYRKETSKQGKLAWYISFNPPSAASIIWIGGSPTNLSEFKQEITSVVTPGFTIEKEEPATIDGNQGTKLIVQGGGASYKSYIYFVPFLNVPYVFQGPALESSSQFQECEPQVFQKMLETFKFPQVPAGGGTGTSGWQPYANLDCKFSFDYPDDWDIKDVYFYETAGGEKATTPTVILGRKSDPKDASSNQIWINMRQGFCMPEMATKSTDSAGSVPVTIYKYPDNSWCAEAEVEGLDINGKKAAYQFVSKFNDSKVKDIFKGVVKSFQVIK